MERSQRVRDAYLRLLEDLSSGAVSSPDQLAFTGEGASLIGSDPSEWWMGTATRQAWTDLSRAFRAIGMRILPGDSAAYTEGSIGWVVDRPTFRNREGTEVQSRMTSIFRQDGDNWKVIHVHNSLGVPNEQTEAFQGADIEGSSHGM